MSQIREDMPGHDNAHAALHDDNDARRRAEGWRMPQLLMALITPVLGLVAVVFNMMGSDGNANIAGALSVITGASAALFSVEVWRLHRIASKPAV